MCLEISPTPSLTLKIQERVERAWWNMERGEREILSPACRLMKLASWRVRLGIQSNAVGGIKIMVELHVHCLPVVGMPKHGGIWKARGKA